MKYKNLIFPLSLALILGGLSSWLERISTLEVTEVKLPPDQPQYAIEKLHASRFDVSGSLKEHLLAQKAWQLPEQDNIYLQHADLQTFLNNQTQYSVQGLSARYHLKEKKVYFENEVVLEKAADNQKPAAIIKTSELVVDTQKQTAQTSQAIEFTYGQSHGRAQGAFYDHTSGKLDLPSQVKAMIYDIKQQDVKPEN